MATKDYLLSNLPDFLKELDPKTKTNNLIGFLSAAGAYLDDTKEAIDHFKNFFDSYNGTYYNITNALSDYGYSMPKRFPEQDVRRFLRDHVDIIKRVGTFEELILIFRMIGIEVEIMEAWVLDPRSARKGYLRDPSGFLTKVPFTNSIYQRFLYGSPSITPDGVMFKGYTYTDAEKSTELSYYIHGEDYLTPIYQKNIVAKTPYISVRLLSDVTIFDGDDTNTPVNLEVGTYVDEKGTSYYYTTNEKYTLITELIEFFLVKEMRPTTVKVTNISTLHVLSDEFGITDENDPFTMVDFDSVGTTHPHPMQDSMTINDNFVIDNEAIVTDPDVSTVTVSDTIKTITTYPVSPVVGDAIIIGSDETPLLSSSSVIGALTLSDQTTFMAQESYNWTATTNTFNYYLDSGVYLVVRAKTTISFINTTSSTVTVYGKETSDVVVKTVNVGENVTIPVGEYRFYRLAGTGTLSITIVANSYNE